MLRRRVVMVWSFALLGVVSCGGGSHATLAASGGSSNGGGGSLGTGGAPVGGTGGAGRGSGGETPMSGTGGASGSGGTMGSGGAGGSGAGDSGTPNVFVALLQLSPQNDRCLPQALPTSNSNGLVGCRIFFDGIAAGCNQPGLSPVTDQRDLAAVAASLKGVGFQTPAGSLCMLNQLPAPSSAAGPCQDNTVPGWCYVHGSCPPTTTTTPCTQALCETPPLGNITYAVALLVCP